MEQIREYLNSVFNVSPGNQTKLLYSILALLIVIVIRAIVVRIAYHRHESVRTRYWWRKSATYVAAGVVVIVVGSIWSENILGLSTYLGLVSAGLTIALQRPIVNLAGWAFILWQRPFNVGDRIEIGTNRGDVLDQRIFMFTMMEVGNWVDADQSTGRVIHIPNGKVFEEPLANYSKGFQYVWNEVPVLVTFESNWKKAKQILMEVVSKHAEHLSEEAERGVREAANKYMIFYSTLTPTVYTSVRDSGVLLTLRFLSEPRRRRGAEQAMWEDILEEFARCDDIDFAYPTRRYYNNTLEGKDNARANHSEREDAD